MNPSSGVTRARARPRLAASRRPRNFTASPPDHLFVAFARARASYVTSSMIPSDSGNDDSTFFLLPHPHLLTLPPSLHPPSHPPFARARALLPRVPRVPHRSARLRVSRARPHLITNSRNARIIKEPGGRRGGAWMGRKGRGWSGNHYCAVARKVSSPRGTDDYRRRCCSIRSPLWRVRHANPTLAVAEHCSPPALPLLSRRNK